VSIERESSGWRCLCSIVYSVLTKLSTADDSDVDLDGKLPGEMSGLRRLRRLSLKSRNLRDSVGALVMLTSLEFLLVRNTKFSERIPSSIDRLSNLKLLEFNECEMTGTLPSEIGRLSLLDTLHLVRNKLSGSIPVEMMRLEALTSLRIEGWDSTWHSTMIGPIPTEIKQLVRLQHLSFSTYDFASIPSEIGELIELVTLDLSDSTVDFELIVSAPRSGTLPSLVQLQKLEELYLRKSHSMRIRS